MWICVNMQTWAQFDTLTSPLKLSWQTHFLSKNIWDMGSYLWLFSLIWFSLQSGSVQFLQVFGVWTEEVLCLYGRVWNSVSVLMVIGAPAVRKARVVNVSLLSLLSVVCVHVFILLMFSVRRFCLLLWWKLPVLGLSVSVGERARMSAVGFKTFACDQKSWWRF